MHNDGDDAVGGNGRSASPSQQQQQQQTRSSSVPPDNNQVNEPQVQSSRSRDGSESRSGSGKSADGDDAYGGSNGDANGPQRFDQVEGRNYTAGSDDNVSSALEHSRDDGGGGGSEGGGEDQMLYGDLMDESADGHDDLYADFAGDLGPSVEWGDEPAPTAADAEMREAAAPEAVDWDVEVPEPAWSTPQEGWSGRAGPSGRPSLQPGSSQAHGSQLTGGGGGEAGPSRAGDSLQAALSSAGLYPLLARILTLQAGGGMIAACSRVMRRLQAHRAISQFRTCAENFMHQSRSSKLNGKLASHQQEPGLPNGGAVSAAVDALLQSLNDAVKHTEGIANAVVSQAPNVGSSAELGDGTVAASSLAPCGDTIVLQLLMSHQTLEAAAGLLHALALRLAALQSGSEEGEAVTALQVRAAGLPTVVTSFYKVRS